MNLKAKLTALMFGALVLLLAGCHSASQSTQTDASTATNPNAPAATGAAGSSAAPASQPAPPPAPVAIDIPAGTTLAIRLNDGIDTGRTEAGARFDGTLSRPIVINGQEAVPAGSAVSGRVANAVSSGRLNRPAELSLVLTSLKPAGGEAIAISTSAWSVKGESHKKRDAEFIGGGAAGGGLIGALAGGKKGALIGGLVGGAGGTGAAAATGKKEIRLGPETKLSFRLSQPVSVTLAR